MQLVILAAGKGSRIRNLTSNNKCLLSIHGRPLLYYNIELAKNIQANKIIVVVGYQKEQVISYMYNNFSNQNFTICVQDHQDGIVGALRTCQKEISDDFLLCLGDEYLLNPKISQMYTFWSQNTCDILCGIVPDKPFSEIKRTYALEVKDNCVIQVIEKPENPFNSLLGTGYCMFNHKLLKYLSDVPLNNIRNQYELCDWIQIAINNGYICKVFPVGTDAFNINRIDDYKVFKTQNDCFKGEDE